MSAFSYNNKSHTLSAEMGEIHRRMINKYKLKEKANSDIQRAKKMEMYLRKFKTLGDKYRQDSKKPEYQLLLEDQAIEAVADQVGIALGLGAKQGNSLFRWTHKMGQSTALSRGVDDIFEAELSSLLQIAADKAANKGSSIAGGEIVGQLPGNIAAGLIEELGQQGSQILQKYNIASELINAPTARSAKVDVVGYTADLDIEADVRPEWQEFIRIFQGAKMTLKNYSSTSTYESIHLGKTVPQKAILGSLSSLGLNDKQAVHTYYHLITHKPIESEGEHIIHLRFQYELTGGGLYVGKDKLDEADFFVYNDPSSSNIWVRSTKEMIAKIADYTGKIGDPLHSGIVVLKNSFT